jgi:Fur family transcriptional regulator, peroxide stress response regulator
MKKLTKYRSLILSDLTSRDDHPTAKMVFESLKQNSVTVSFATVYNTLEYLFVNKLIHKVEMYSDSYRYDAVLEAHSHTVCKECGLIRDIPLAHNRNESLEGFQADSMSTIFRGVCKNCNVENHSL